MSDNATLTLEIQDPYIGSAYAPQIAITPHESSHTVAVTYDDADSGITTLTFDVDDGVSPTVAVSETSTTITVTITDRSGAHSYTVNKTDAAIAAAESAASAANSAAENANSKATLANNAAGSANDAASNANSKATAANTAAGNANDAASNANAKAGLANSAATAANDAATLANQKAALANDKATLANTAAGNADTATTAANGAATLANTKAGLANDAATLANTKAGLADTAATSANDAATAANTAAAAATEAAESITGAYIPMLVSGGADDLMANSVSAEYIHRESGASADGVARIDVLKGNTVRWNQLNNNSSSTNTLQGVTITNNNDGSWTLNGTATANGTKYFRSGFTMKAGHKYLAKGCPSGGSSSTYYLGFNGNYDDIGAGGINTVGSNDVPGSNFRLEVKTGASFENVKMWPMFFDLTAMFGAGNEPSTVAEFEAMYPNAYYDYDAGSLLNVNIEGVKTVGFNQWDGDWELGEIQYSTGADSQNSNYWRSKNYIPIFPNTTYFAYSPTASGKYIRARFYDANKEYVGGDYASGTGQTGTAFTTPAGAYFMRFVPSVADIPNHDVCINISDTDRNGTYEPHWTSSRSIAAETYFPSGMKSAGTAYDELQRDKAVTRIGAVDLGTLTWEYIESSIQGAGWYFKGSGADGIKLTEGYWSDVPNLKCVKYDAGKLGSVVSNPIDMTITVSNWQAGVIMVKDSTYTDAATFKTAMDGVMFCYELATPTETAISPALSLNYKVGAGSTEQVMVDETADAPQTAPVPMKVSYPANIVSRIAALEAAIAELATS